MALDSKSIPLFAGVLVLLVVGVFIITKGVFGPQGPTSAVADPTEVPTAPTVDLHDQLEAGRASIRAGRLDEAEAQLRQVPKDDPSYLLAVNDLGILFEKLEKHEEALDAYNEILVFQPENPFALFGLCSASIGLGKLEEAEMACLRALEISPRAVRPRYALGLIRVGQDELALGVDAYIRAAKQHNSEDQIRQAALELDAYSKKNPELAGPHYAMAVLARILVSRETEREELEAYLSLAPEGPAAENAREKLDELTEMGF